MGELLDRVSSAELTEWMVFYRMEPFGMERGDLQAGIVAATVANVNRDPKKQKRAWEPADFMPQFADAIEGGAGGRGGKSPEELRRKWDKVLTAFGVKDR